MLIMSYLLLVLSSRDSLVDAYPSLPMKGQDQDLSWGARMLRGMWEAK